MDVKTLSPNQIRKVGLDALSNALGPIGMVRFLHFFDNGLGNYTKEREKWLGKVSTQDIIKEIKERRKRK